MEEVVCECGQRFERTGPKDVCPTCGIEHRSITVTDSLVVSLSENVVIVRRHEDNAVGVRMAGDLGRDISADLQPGGETESSIRAHPRTNEQNVPEVARIFQQHLNNEGAAWLDPEICANVSAKEERGVDFILREGDRSMECQVVRPGYQNFKLWPRIAGGDTVQMKQVSAEAAEDLKKAIERKERKIPPRDRSCITLVIDVIETPALVLGSVPDEFRRLYGAWAKSLKFGAIWIVGPTSQLTFKLT
jgi:hypothetical protein